MNYGDFLRARLLRFDLCFCGEATPYRSWNAQKQINCCQIKAKSKKQIYIYVIDTPTRKKWKGNITFRDMRKYTNATEWMNTANWSPKWCRKLKKQKQEQAENIITPNNRTDGRTDRQRHSNAHLIHDRSRDGIRRSKHVSPLGRRLLPYTLARPPSPSAVLSLALDRGRRR